MWWISENSSLGLGHSPRCQESSDFDIALWLYLDCFSHPSGCHFRLWSWSPWSIMSDVSLYLNQLALWCRSHGEQRRTVTGSTHGGAILKLLQLVDSGALAKAKGSSCKPEVCLKLEMLGKDLFWIPRRCSSGELWPFPQKPGVYRMPAYFTFFSVQTKEACTDRTAYWWWQRPHSHCFQQKMVAICHRLTTLVSSVSD